MGRWRTSTFRLIALYTAIFALCGSALVTFIYWQSASYMTQQADTQIEWQGHYFESLGAEAIIEEIAQRISNAHVHVTFVGLFSRDGTWLAGDLPELPAGLPIDRGKHTITDLRSTVVGSHVALARASAFRLRSGDILLLARDLDEVRELRASILRALVLGSGCALVIAFAGIMLVTLRRNTRIRALREVAEHIARGDLQRRLPPSGSDELDMLAHIVNHMLDEIERLMGEIKSTCDSIAHDLRSPLSRARTLLARATLMNPGAAGEPLERALGEIDVALARFRALLRISELETMHRRSGFSTFDLRGLVSEVADLYAPLAEDKDIAFESRLVDAGSIHADRALLFEALGNMLDNAIKFTPPGGAVRIDLRKQAQGASIDVFDSGPGISPDERKAVTQRFYRSEQTAQLPGSGLGLSVVAAVIRLHNFALHIDDATPHATTGTRISVDCWPQPLAQ
ncbi:sensor histidine kinase [Pararobbsia silviterrae]|uniref:histidine kinase n=1 Tax=Pararobbsia silviterrae TaxID=1792498 RepID=A0A494Y7F5_9BURK|nr:HAMP domain-containing sensor histidine kinase [Pararobbsia silviterrae]RKP55860.1 sensor histidine kinase [Pararobbsia silviterrae]